MKENRSQLPHKKHDKLTVCQYFSVCSNLMYLQQNTHSSDSNTVSLYVLYEAYCLDCSGVTSTLTNRNVLPHVHSIKLCPCFLTSVLVQKMLPLFLTLIMLISFIVMPAFWSVCVLCFLCSWCDWNACFYLYIWQQIILDRVSFFIWATKPSTV